MCAVHEHCSKRLESRGNTDGDLCGQFKERFDRYPGQGALSGDAIDDSSRNVIVDKNGCRTEDNDAMRMCIAKQSRWPPPDIAGMLIAAIISANTL